MARRGGRYFQPIPRRPRKRGAHRRLASPLPRSPRCCRNERGPRPGCRGRPRDPMGERPILCACRPRRRAHRRGDGRANSARRDHPGRHLARAGARSGHAGPNPPGLDARSGSLAERRLRVRSSCTRDPWIRPRSSRPAVPRRSGCDTRNGPRTRRIPRLPGRRLRLWPRLCRNTDPESERGRNCRWAGPRVCRNEESGPRSRRGSQDLTVRNPDLHRAANSPSQRSHRRPRAGKCNRFTPWPARLQRHSHVGTPGSDAGREQTRSLEHGRTPRGRPLRPDAGAPLAPDRRLI